MIPERKLIRADSVAAGDVILCYKADKKNLGSGLIKRFTDSEYSHAAIAIGNGMAAESVPSGFRTLTIVTLAEQYDHIAIFRQPCWTDRRLKELTCFVQAVVETNAKYNGVGILKFILRGGAHRGSLHEQLTEFFNGDLEPISPDQDQYFCSEFVAACFIKVGIIDQSAAVIYRPGFVSPGDLGKDPTFGTFVGYVSAREYYMVPPEDEFYSETTFDEIHSKD